MPNHLREGIAGKILPGFIDIHKLTIGQPCDGNCRRIGAKDGCKTLFAFLKFFIRLPARDNVTHNYQIGRFSFKLYDVGIYLDRYPRSVFMQ
jgi:hypothetical protein